MKFTTRQLVPWLGALTIVLVISQMSAGFHLHMVIVTGLSVLTASSLNLIYGFAGQISLGHAAFYGIGAYTSAILSLEHGWNPWLGVVAAGLLAFVVGGVIAYPAFRTTGIYFSIVTLSVGVIVHIVMVNWVSLTKGAQGLPGVPPLSSLSIPGVLELDFLDRKTFAYLIWALVGLWMVISARLLRSRLGDSWIAIRENERLARSLGVATYHRKVLAQAIASGVVGAVGGLFAHYLGIVSPSSFIPTASLMILVVVVVGGAGRLFGPLVGAIVLTAAPEFLRFAQAFRLVLFGLVLILVVLFLPRGLIGIGDSLATALAGVRKMVRRSTHSPIPDTPAP
jgi:branched-chain amino acid transport system permease protein